MYVGGFRLAPLPDSAASRLWNYVGNEPDYFAADGNPLSEYQLETPSLDRFRCDWLTPPTAKNRTTIGLTTVGRLSRPSYRNNWSINGVIVHLEKAASGLISISRLTERR